MHYKVIELNSDIQREEIGTCDLCFSTDWVENGDIVIEDETGKRYEIPLTWWDWGHPSTIYIDNVVDFSAKLQELDLPETEDVGTWSWLEELVEKLDN